MCIYFVSGLMLEQRLEMTKHLVKTSMKFNFPRVAYQRTTKKKTSAAATTKTNISIKINYACIKTR